MARRNDHSRDELQKLMLDAACDIIREHGKDALTARSLAAKVGYVPGSIYHVYGSMEGLILHINARTLEQMHAALAATLPKKKDGRKTAHQLMALAKAYRAFVEGHKSFWLLLFDTKLPKDRTSFKWYQEKVDGLFSLLETVLSPVFRRTEAKKMRMAARVLWSSFHGLCYLEEKGQFDTIGKDAGVADMTKFFVENFLKGLGKG